MRYVSTRGAAPALDFEATLLAGLASDGGLYLPETLPPAPTDLDPDRPYAAVAGDVIAPFVGGAIDRPTLDRLLGEAYEVFRHPSVTPLKEFDSGVWLMELFHGPTLAFKDVALQLLGRLFDHVLTKRGERITIVGATSGDTGSAAIEAVRGSASVEIFMLHPKGRVTDVQRRQMTTVEAANVHNIAIEGSFDDCQDLVKALFNDPAFRGEVRLSAVNSINWARVVAQVVYYARAACKLARPGRPVSFAVPTGNFGNVLAAHIAKRLGFPIGRLILGSNSNDILTRFLDTGAMTMADVTPTLSPSMDIQVSSNFERLLFEALGRDGDRVAKTLADFRRTGSYALPDDAMAMIRRDFVGSRADDARTLEVMADAHARHGELVDPHTAVGLAAVQDCAEYADGPIVVAGTAHPAKFPDAVERATGVRPALPPHLADLLDRPERFEVLPNDAPALQAHIRNALAMAGAA